MIDGLVGGKVHGKPTERVARNGSKFATATVRVALRDGGTIFASVITFSASAITALLALTDGDSIAVSGELTPKVWTDREGNAKPQLDVLVHQVMTPYAVQRKRAAVNGAKPPEREPESAPRSSPPDFDDDLPA